MNTTPSSALHVTSTTASAGERALVLGGGGSAGNAWLIGVIAGLFDAGLGVTGADLLAGVLAAAPRSPAGPGGSDRGRAPIGPAAGHMETTSEIIAAAEDPAD